MDQIGAAPKSSLKALEETVKALRQLLSGEAVTMPGDQVHLAGVQIQMAPAEVPPVYVGAMREKSLRLAGRVGDGTILTGMSSPAYVRWAREHIQAGMAESGRRQHRVVVYLDVKVQPDGRTARAEMRLSLGARFPWADVHLSALGITEQVAAFLQEHDREGIGRHMPDKWVDAFSAAGTPEQVAEAIQRWAAAGADAIVFQPLDGDPECLEEYSRYLMPLLKSIAGA